MRIITTTMLLLCALSMHSQVGHLDFSVYDWPNQSTENTYNFTLNGQDIDVTIKIEPMFAGEWGCEGLAPREDGPGSLNAFGNNTHDLALCFTPEITGQSTIKATVTFTKPVTNVSFDISDIDFQDGENGHRDSVMVYADTDVMPTLSYKTENPTFEMMSTNTALGSVDNSLGDDDGTVQVSFGSDVIESFTIMYDDSAESADNRAIGILDQFFFTSASVLPVELVDFEARNLGDGQVEVNWTTLSEINNEGFQIQHGTEGVDDFMSLQMIEGNGNSAYRQDYTTILGNIPSGVNFFRLKQMDYEGNESYSDIISLYIEQDQEDIIISPNPITGSRFFVLNGGEIDKSQVSIFSLTGQRQSFQLTSNGAIHQINLPDLSAGLYILKWKNKTSKILIGGN